jgi:hypothetical protein
MSNNLSSIFIHKIKVKLTVIIKLTNLILIIVKHALV